MVLKLYYMEPGIDATAPVNYSKSTSASTLMTLLVVTCEWTRRVWVARRNQQQQQQQFFDAEYLRNGTR